MTDRTDASPPPRLALVGFRFDENSSFLRGAADAPPLIREALSSEHSNSWAENGTDLAAAFFDAGDVSPAPGTDMLTAVEGAIKSLLARGLSPVSLGGDHSVTYPIVRAVARRHPNLSILHFDAHPDLYDELLGNRHSHASPFARIMEEGLARRLVQVGVRTMNGHQREQAARFGVEVLEMRDWRDGVRLSLESPVYISFDVDGLDPSCAPGVSHREPGGLTTRQALDVIHGVRARIVGADIVEYNPAADFQNMTATVCAKLLKEIAAQMLGGEVMSDE